DVPALAPILGAARRYFPVKIFAQALRGNLTEFPYRTPQFGKDLGELALDNTDLKLAMQMNGRIRLDELIAHGRGELGSAYGLLWFLNLTGDLAFSKTPVAGAGNEQYTAAADTIVPRKRKPLPPETVADLRDD